jgi:hypothetical protein
MVQTAKQLRTGTLSWGNLLHFGGILSIFWKIAGICEKNGTSKPRGNVLLIPTGDRQILGHAHVYRCNIIEIAAIEVRTVAVP